MANSVPIQFRWNSQLYQQEAKALKIVNGYLQENPDLLPRTLFADMAVFYHDNGVKPETRNSQKDIMVKLTRLEKLVESSSAELRDLVLTALNGIDLSAYRDTNGRSLEDELGDTLDQDVYATIFKGVQAKTFPDED